MSFSVKNFRNRPATLTLRDPTTGISLTKEESNTTVDLEIAGMDSKVFEEAKSEVQVKVYEAMTRDKKKLDKAEHKQLSLEMFVALIVGWNPTAAEFFSEELGDSNTYSPENALKIVSNPDYYWIVVQIEEFIKDRQRFFTKQ
jgi:hypothetical protein